MTKLARRDYADGPFGQIHFQWLGAGRPIVLLHQSPMTSYQYDNVYWPLAQRGFRAIGIDMPGFGLSDPPSHIPEITDYARAVTPVLDALAIKSAVILGHHTGALVANEVAIEFADRVDAVILNGPLIPTEQERQVFFDTEYVWERSLEATTGAGHMRQLFELREQHAAGTISLDRISNYVVQTLMGRGKFWFGHRAAYAYDQERRLPLICQPGMILTNTGDVIYEHAQRAHALRPDFELVALQGGGVDIVDQQPEAWAEAVTRFAGR